MEKQDPISLEEAIGSTVEQLTGAPADPQRVAKAVAMFREGGEAKESGLTNEQAAELDEIRERFDK